GTPAANRNLAIALASANGGISVSHAAASLTVNGNAYLGGTRAGAAGAFQSNLSISAGVATITGTLKLYSSGAVSISGGVLNVGNPDFSSVGASNFVWSGGTINLTGGELLGVTSLTVPGPCTLSGYGVIPNPVVLTGAMHVTSPVDVLTIHG